MDSVGVFVNTKPNGIFNFEDFERDVDCIAKRIEDEENIEEIKTWTDEEKKEKIVVTREDKTLGNERLSDIITYLLDDNEKIQDTCNIGEIQDSNSYRLNKGFDKFFAENQIVQKNVEFDLPDITEYSDDFTGASVGEESDREFVLENNDKYGNENQQKVDLNTSEKTWTNLITGSEIERCSKCICRLTKMHIFDLSGQDSLFSKGKVKERGPHLKNKSQIPRKKQASSSKNKCYYKTENFGNKRGAIKHTRKHPIDANLAESDNASVLQWLKLKNIEKKKKKTAEKIMRREKKQANKLKELDKICRREISDEKVKEWMKKKSRLCKTSNGCVAPFNEAHFIKDTDGAPEGYTIVHSFEKISSPQGKKYPHLRNEKNVKMVKKSAKNEESTIAPTENKKIFAKAQARKSYEEWLQEKKILAQSDNAKQVIRVVGDDRQLVLKERGKIQAIKDYHSQKIDCKRNLQLDSKPINNVSLKVGRQEQIEKTQNHHSLAEKM